jgi:hypothetical protein
MQRQLQRKKSLITLKLDREADLDKILKEKVSKLSVFLKTAAIVVLKPVWGEGCIS